MGAGRIIGSLSKTILGEAGKGLYKAQKGYTTVALGLSQGIRPIRAGAGKIAKKTLISKTEKSFDNAYTGYKVSPLGNHLTGWGGTVGVAAVVGMGAGAGPMAGVNTKIPGLDGIETRASKVGVTSYGGHPAAMDADGVGSATQAPTLGATGDLVFGLNNNRRG